MGTQNTDLTQFIFWQNLLYRQNIYIYLLKKYHHHWIMTNIVTFPKKYFLWKFNYTTFFGQSAPLHPKQKLSFCFGSVILKLKAAAFQNTLELYHDQIIWGRNYCVNLDNAVLLPPQNVLCSLFLDVKPFFTMEKEKHHSRWLTPLERYDWDNLYALFWWVNIFWFWC